MTLLFTSNIDGYGSYESWAISDVEVHLSGAALPSHSSSHGLIITHRLLTHPGIPGIGTPGTVPVRAEATPHCGEC